ncbi:MAG: hypothetical protein NVS4B7_09180 [Ktedonobacteraceae bacterium]
MISIILGIIYSIVINAVLPFIIYSLLKSYTNLSDFWALVITGVPPMIDAIVSIIRKGHIDLIGGIVLLGIAVSIILILLGGSPRLLLIRESFFTAALGLAYLVSLLFPRPLSFYFARQFATGNVPERVAWFNSLWQYPGFRFSMRLTAVVWGVGFMLEVIVRLILVFTLTIPQFLILSPFVFYGFLGAIMLWTFLYTRKGRKRAEATRPQMPEEQNK